MSEAFWLAAAFLTALTGMGGLALAMPRHWQQVFNKASRSASKQLRIFGVFALLLSAAFCALADHPSMAILVWIMLLTVAASVVSMALAWLAGKANNRSDRLIETDE